jgi:hypothetical protein
VTGGTAGLGDDLLHVLNLSLAADEGTEALLSELAGTLVLGIAEQLNHTALIGGKADDLASDLADERSAAGRLALGTADLVLGGVKGSGFL